MKRYKIETVNLERLMQLKNKISFFTLIESDKFNVYIESENEGIHFNKIYDIMGEESEELLEEFLINMKTLSYDMVKSKNNRNIILLMLIFLDVNYGELPKGGYSYCSHIQGFFTFFKDNKRIKEYFEKKFNENYSELSKIYSEYLKIKESNSEMYNISNNTIKTIKEKIKPHIENGEIIFLKDDHEINLLENSKFHSRLYENTEFIKRMETIDFKIKRFITICQYYFLDTIGVSYKERCYYCYLIYRFIEVIYEFEYEEILIQS